MKYFRAKKDAYDYFSKRGIVENELLTEKERNRYVPYLHDCLFEQIDISKRDTYTMFGCRFQIKH